MRRANIPEGERIDQERKGAFYTPPVWVELSQQYLAEELGEGWQEKYYVWDCAAGIGNLLMGLERKERVFGSTLDARDVPVMRERYPHIPNSHLFQFDFLSDPLEKLPEQLRQIVESSKLRKRLVIYINPPYAEAASGRTVPGTGANKPGVATEYPIKREAHAQIGMASNELFALFLYRIQRDFEGCVIGVFSKLKPLQSPNFTRFREFFRAELKRLFIVPSYSFDNVTGEFPIGFHIWQTKRKPLGSKVKETADIYVLEGGIPKLAGTRFFSNVMPDETINHWMSEIARSVKIAGDEGVIGRMSSYPPDRQNNQRFAILSVPQKRTTWTIRRETLIPFSVYFAVRLCISSSWLTQSDIFLAPSKEWEQDSEFHADCLAFTLFHGKLYISREKGVNHWIPFTEGEVEPRGAYASRWMVEFLAGRLEGAGQNEDGIMGNGAHPWATGRTPIGFSPEAQLVLDVGRELFQYYHQQRGSHPDASFYDIRAHFQGFTRGGTGKAKMNPKSSDAHYMELLEGLRGARERLARKIAPKVYQYGFLLGESEG